MPNHRATDPLVTLPLRVPASVRAQLAEFAAERGGTISDALRAHLTLEAVKPMGAPRPARRAPGLGTVSGVDPSLLRHLAMIGSNLNQISRAVNSGAASGRPVNLIQVLAVLGAIEAEIDSLSKSQKSPRGTRS